MSINSAMRAGVSGLVANSSALSAISDNIANVNTTAYKRNQVNFANIVTGQAVSGRYSAGGVQGTTRSYISEQGLIQSASSPTDLAISGDGFFVVTQRSGALDVAQPRYFTRSGSFSVDDSGFLKNDAGFYLQGWLVNDDGSIDTDASDLTAMQSIQVRDLTGVVRPSSSVSINANINKTQAISAGEAAYDGATVNSMADYADDNTTGTRPDFTIDMNVVDSSGGLHTVTLALLRSSANANEWHAEIYASPATDVTGTPRPGQLAQGLLVFDQDGDIDLTATTLFGGAGNTPELVLDASGGAATPRWSDGQGIAAQTIALDLDRLTQLASASTVQAVNADGARVGSVVGVEVDENGFVSAIFDNNEVRRIAQLGVATFLNPDGLQSVSGNAYRASVASGEFSIKQAGLGGAGQIAASALEASTVDLSSEFTGLITTQRAYSASSRIITTADQMLEELISLKR